MNFVNYVFTVRKVYVENDENSVKLEVHNNQAFLVMIVYHGIRNASEIVRTTRGDVET